MLITKVHIMKYKRIYNWEKIRKLTIAGRWVCKSDYKVLNKTRKMTKDKVLWLKRMLTKGHLITDTASCR